MLTLYSYPQLFGLADNNGYGLKVFAFLKLAGIPFDHKHIFDGSGAPRGQLPYAVDDDTEIGGSDAIIAHSIKKYRVAIDAQLTPSERDMSHLIDRMLDDLYWVMSYSRWKDEQYRPAFLRALLREHSNLTEEDLLKAQQYNAQRYHYQGIGRYSPADAYARGIADLQVLAHLVPSTGFVHGPTPTTIDAAIYGFIANIHFYDIDTPLRKFVAARPNLIRHCTEIHGAIS